MPTSYNTKLVYTEYTECAEVLPGSDEIITALNRIVEVFGNPVEIEVVKTRWEKIKKLSYSIPEILLSTNFVARASQNTSANPTTRVRVETSDITNGMRIN